MAIYMKRATRDDCEAVACDLRLRDEAELRASDGDPREAIIKGWLASPSFCFAGYDEHSRALGILGVCEASREWSCPWLVGTNALEFHRRELAVLSVRLFPRIAARFPNMKNYVDARNGVSIAWLARLGFRLGEPVAYGVAGLDFVPFWIGGDDECVLRF